jgi:alpha-galactosidase
MAMLTAYMLKHTKIKTVGLCHSVQDCIPQLFDRLKMGKKHGQSELEPKDIEKVIFGINHQSWLLSAKTKDGVDLYPEIKERARLASKGIIGKLGAFGSGDRVRFKIMETFGYYMTESSEHNAEYCPWFIKRARPLSLPGELRFVNKYRIPINEYLYRCRRQIAGWKSQSKRLLADANIKHNKSHEYGSFIITALHTGVPFKFSGNVLNTAGYVSNLPRECCVEVPIIAGKDGLVPQMMGALPEQLAAYNMTSIMPQMLTLKANETRKMNDLIMAVAMDPHTGAICTLDEIESMCRALYARHRKDNWMPEYTETNDSRDADYAPENMQDVETV